MRSKSSSLHQELLGLEQIKSEFGEEGSEGGHRSHELNMMRSTESSNQDDLFGANNIPVIAYN